MRLDLKEKVLRALPMQAIGLSGGDVILKRGALETHVAGERAAEVIEQILGELQRGGATRATITGGFAEIDRAAVEALLNRLFDRRLIEEVDGQDSEAGAAQVETELDVFYWNVGQPAGKAIYKLNESRIVIIGVNQISRRLAESLRAGGMESLEVIDYELLRNVRLFDDSGNLESDRWGMDQPTPYDEWAETLSADGIACLVATSDFGGLHWMRQWNEVAVTSGIHFMPVVLQNLIGWVGPLVVPGETACFECVRARQNAHLSNPALERAPELVAFEGQAINGFHPAMASILGDIAAMELTKLYGGALPLRNVGRLIEVNLLLPQITTHKVLKLPRCAVCGALSKYPAATPLRSTFLPGNRPE